VQRFAREVILQLDECLQAAGCKDKFLILVPNDAKNLPNFKNIKIIKTRLRGSHFWEQFFLPFLSRKYALLSLSGSAPLMHFNQYITIHDAAVFDAYSAYSKTFVFWYRLLFFVQSHCANKVITVSKYSAERLSRALPALIDKIIIVHNGSEHILKTRSCDKFLLKHNLQSGGYYFLLGSFNPNKNIAIIYSVAKMLEKRNIIFVISGGVGSRSFARLNSHGATLRNIRYVGNVNDEELKALYLNAKGLIFPSIYEGFGIPPIEALALGVTVMASDIPAVKEVGGDLISYFDPRNPFELMKLIINSENGIIKSNNQKKINVCLNKFNWKKSSSVLFEELKKNL
jgi:glycosyltransferase involved in cell wall biosynthesis